MRTVRLRNWLSDFAPLSDDLSGLHKNYVYYSRRRAFNPALVYFATLAAFGTLSFYNRAGFVGVVVQLLFALYLGLSARAVARGLSFRRTTPQKVSQGDVIEIGFEVENPSSFAAVDIVLTDRFSGSHKPEEVIWLDEPIGKFRSVRGSYKKVCDAGMGVFSYGPMTALVSDPLGLFQFLVTDDDTSRTQVYPKVTPLPNLPIQGSKESFNFGLYDVASRGLSSNFIGVRGYERGDSLRHISWKLSMKAQKLLVKEFEKSVNAEITLILDMSAKDHMGWAADSTWEYGKSIALSIISREIANGNQLQLFSNYQHISGGSGEAHNLELIRAVFNLMPIDDPGTTDLVSRASVLVRNGTTVVYIGPVFRGEFRQTETSLARLRAEGNDVLAILLDAGSFVSGKVQGILKAAVEAKISKGRQVLDSALANLARAGVLTYLIENGSDIGREMLAPNAHVPAQRGQDLL